jgi:hypothetical protein
MGCSCRTLHEEAAKSAPREYGPREAFAKSWRR